MTVERWKEVKKNPQWEFHIFLAQHRLRAMDSGSTGIVQTLLALRE